MIKIAKLNDIPYIEDILKDAVNWMDTKNILNLWNEHNIRWDVLSKNYKIEDFYIDYINNIPVGCMAVTDIDVTYWSDVKQGTSLYIHKLAVKQDARGRGISKELIDFAKEKAYSKNINEIRLDCNANRIKLRALYEEQGFQIVKKILTDKGYELALYSCNLN